MLIVGSSSLFTFDDRDDYFKLLTTQSNVFCFDNNDVYNLRSKMNKLISSLALTYTYCLPLRMTGKAKPSEEKSQESELSTLVILVDDNKKEKDFWLSQVLLKSLLLTGKRLKKFQMMGKGSNRKMWW